jgi:hypothetical protein
LLPVLLSILLDAASGLGPGLSMNWITLLMSHVLDQPVKSAGWRAPSDQPNKELARHARPHACKGRRKTSPATGKRAGWCVSKALFGSRILNPKQGRIEKQHVFNGLSIFCDFIGEAC